MDGPFFTGLVNDYLMLAKDWLLTGQPFFRPGICFSIPVRSFVFGPNPFRFQPCPPTAGAQAQKSPPNAGPAGKKKETPRVPSFPLKTTASYCRATSLGG